MSFNLSAKALIFGLIAIVIVADASINLFVGAGAANKTLDVPEIPKAPLVSVAASANFDPDVIDGLFGLTAVLKAREQERVKQLALEAENESATQEPEQSEQVLVIGKEQFRLFGVSSVGMQQYAILSINNAGAESELLELELGETLDLLDGMALLRLERVGVQSVLLRVTYRESEEQMFVDLALFKNVE